MSIFMKPIFQAVLTRVSAIALLSLFFVLQAAPAGQTHSGYADQLRASYQKPVKCTLCHIPSGLKQTGWDLAKLKPQAATLRRTIAHWALIDSDGDGFDNLTEIKQGCDPNRAAENPSQGNCKPVVPVQ
jgi:hypothetical protein